MFPPLLGKLGLNKLVLGMTLAGGGWAQPWGSQQSSQHSCFHSCSRGEADGNQKQTGTAELGRHSRGLMTLHRLGSVAPSCGLCFGQGGCLEEGGREVWDGGWDKDLGFWHGS